MLKREIKYIDQFSQQPEVDICYFGLSKPELLELEAEWDVGFDQMIQQISDAKDYKELVKLFKKLIFMSYGEREGKHFVKNEELSRRFSYTTAYAVLYMELATNDQAGLEFIEGIMPADMVPEKTQDKPAGPPKPPTA